MHKKLIARTAKLLSETKKGRRFKGIAITYEHIPTDLDERNHGSIFAVININTANPEAEEITELIIDTFHGEFYQDLAESPLASFEAALAKVNEELAEATHQGNVGWLNNLNAVLAVLSNNTLHVSQSGKTEAYLYRGERSSHITDNLAGDSVNPLRTFVNIASGELQEGDKVTIVTPSVFYHISKDELKRYIKEFQPKVAISHLADLIEGTSAEVNPNAILVLEAITPEAASNETLDQQPDEVWISEPAKPIETAIETATPFLKRVFEILAAGYAATKLFIADKIVPFAKDAGGKTKEFYGNWRENRVSKTPKEGVLYNTSESLVVREDNDSLEENESTVITKTKEKTGKNEIFIKETTVKPKWIKLEKVDFSPIGQFGDKFTKLFKKYTKNKKMTLIVAVCVFALFVGGTLLVLAQRKSAGDLKLANASYTEAENKYNFAKTAISSGNLSQAVTELNSAKTITENLKTNNKLKDKATSLLAQIQQTLDQAENIVRPSITTLADASSIVGKNPLGPYIVSGNAFLINRDNGSIAAVSLKNNEVSNVLSKANVDGKIVAGTVVSARNIIVVISDKGTLYEFDTKEDSLSKQSVADTVTNPVAISSFSTNIYILGSDGKVFKKTKTSTGYSKNAAYITDNNYLNNPVDLKIDSNIYVLSADGNANKYLSGKKQNYALNNLPETIQNAKGFFTNEDTNGLYVINGNDRIFKFDSNGKFINQFGEISNLSGIWVDDTSKTIFALSSGKLLKFSF